MSETYEPGELFVYTNGDRWELGEVKSANNTGTGYFCWYSTGDTAANTPTSHMHKLANAGWSHIEKLREIIKRLNDEARTCENTQEDFDFMCSVCGKCVDNGRVLGFEYCPRCGRRIVG